jgi:ABC-type phosphate transport system substrate-binding protein
VYTRCIAGYNIPELKNHTLVLTFEILAGIYMNNITMWDDYRIKAVNTAEVAALLPAQVIYVCLQSTASETTLLFTSVLSAVVPEFAAAVRRPNIYIYVYIYFYALCASTDWS